MIPFQSFPSTQWTRLEQERASDSTPDWFCESYRPAILSYLRRHMPHHDAEDLCQEFFRQVVLDGPLIDRADRARGSLRGLLRLALARFLASHWRRSATVKRGGQASQRSLDEAGPEGERWELPGAPALEPDRAFDKAWATLLLARAMARTEQFCREQGKQAVFDALSPLLDGSGPVRGHPDLAAELGISTREVTLAVRHLRLRVGRYLHEEVLATLAAGGSAADEMDAIRQALREE